VLLRRRTGEITVVAPNVLDFVPDEDMAEVLLGSWSEEEILRYLYQRSQRASPQGD